MIDVATKYALIKKITLLPESSPDEPEDRSTEIEKLREVQTLLAAISDIVKGMLEHEEQRAKSWQTTVEAMEAARRGELVTVGDIDGLFADLHSDDADD